MNFLIKKSFNLFNKWKDFINYQLYEENSDKYKSPIIIESFLNNDKVLLRHRDIKDVKLLMPINHSLSFNFDDIEEELKRFTSIYNYRTFFDGKKFNNKRLVIYIDNNPLLIGILDLIIQSNKYSEYHIFCNSIESYNAFKYIEKRKYKSIVRLNTIEENFDSMLRIIMNEWEDYYNDSRICNDDIILFLNKYFTFSQIGCALNYLSNFFISIPYNQFVIKMLQIIYYQIYNIEIINNINEYVLLKITPNNNKPFTLEKIINQLDKICSKYYKETLEIIQFLFKK